MEDTAMLNSSGRPAKDQIVRSYDDGSSEFISYGWTVVRRPFNYPQEPIVLDEEKWNHSITTARYRNRFLGESTGDTRRRIKSGQYVLASLNT